MIIERIKIIAFIFNIVILFSSTIQAQPSNLGSKKPFAKLIDLPFGSVKPSGWLSQYLWKQRDGLTGHLEEGKFPFNSEGWLKPRFDNVNSDAWWPYEQMAYWVDGMTRCGYLLNDTFLINKANRQLNYVLAHPDAAGYLGPDLGASQKMFRWPHAVFFRAYMARYDITGETEILEKLTRHFLNNPYLHTEHREAVNIESIMYLFEKTGDTALLHLAEKIYDTWAPMHKDSDASPQGMKKEGRLWEHGVTFNEIAKLGPILYMYTGEKKYLTPSINGYQRVEKFHMLEDGMHVSSEGFRQTDPLESHEACDITDFTWSLGYMIMATGNAHYADMTEKVIFNALPGQVTNDFKALQYFSCPNQVVSTGTSNHNIDLRGGAGMRYGPNPLTACCPANITRALPNYISRMWMRNQDSGLTAVFYGPSKVHLKTTATTISIDEQTHYPFSEKITFNIKLSHSVVFPLGFRIPEWCLHPSLLYNGKIIRITCKAGQFFKVSKKLNNNDIFVLYLPQAWKMADCGTNGIAFEKGPLVYSLNIKSKITIATDDTLSSIKFPAYNMLPAAKWNYAVSCSKAELMKMLSKQHPMFKDSYPFDDNNPPTSIKIPVHKVSGWDLIKTDTVHREEWVPIMQNGKLVNWEFYKDRIVSGKFILTPALPNDAFLKKNIRNEIETIELIPYGCTKLRMTIFPFLPTGDTPQK